MNCVNCSDCKRCIFCNECIDCNNIMLSSTLVNISKCIELDSKVVPENKNIIYMIIQVNVLN